MNDRYAGERFSPKTPACGRAMLSLVFDGQTLTAAGSQTPIHFPAVSGKATNGKFDYSVVSQKVPDRGPIPDGEYWIQPSELQENAWYRVRNSRSGWGDFWITIHPYPTTNTHKRGGFFVHGGKNPGSAGCIDLSSNMDRFVEAIQKELSGKPECYIPLTVRYPK